MARNSLLFITLLICSQSLALPVDWNCRKQALSKLDKILRRTAKRLGNSRYLEIQRACEEFCTKQSEKQTEQSCFLPQKELNKIEETLLSAHRIIPTLLHRPSKLEQKGGQLSSRAKRVLAEATLYCDMRFEEIATLLSTEPKIVVKQPSSIFYYIKFGPLWLKFWGADQLACALEQIPSTQLDPAKKHDGCSTTNFPPYSCNSTTNAQLHGLQKLRFIHQIQPKD